MTRVGPQRHKKKSNVKYKNAIEECYLQIANRRIPDRQELNNLHGLVENCRNYS